MMVYEKHLKKAGLFLNRFAQDPKGEIANVYFRLRPEDFYKRCISKARDQGLKQLYFLLSFDCDTEKDFEVAVPIYEALSKMGIRPIFAVPGELLEQGASVYCELFKKGAEFINHGYYKHSKFNDQTRLYESLFFYEQIAPSRIEEDIRLGHQAIQNTLGISPRGFRAPHFPTYQKPLQISFIHKICSDLGYEFSSSTVPRKAYEQGPFFYGTTGIMEFPVTGCYSKPFSILDSWSFRYAPLSTQKAGDFRKELDLLRNYYTHHSRRTGIINLYADPSQVYDWPEFFDAVRPLAQWNIPSYSELVKICEKNFSH